MLQTLLGQKKSKEAMSDECFSVSLLSVVSKVFEKLVNNRIVDHLEKCGLFSDFQYGFTSFCSTADLLTVVYDSRAFNRSVATQAVALDISKDFNRVWHAGLLHKLKSYIQLMLEFLKGLFFILHFSCYTLMTFQMTFLFLSFL